MSDLFIKPENDEDEESSESLCALTTLLQEVKKEEQKEFGENENQTNNDKEDADMQTLPESFFDDLYREELEAAPAEASTDDDIQRLEEMIARKKRILHDVVTEDQSIRSRKRKEDESQQESNNLAKRSRTITETLPSNDNTSPAHPVGNNSNQEPQQATTSAGHTQNVDPELELENLLNTPDFNSDQEPPIPDQKMQFNHMAMQSMQSIYGFNAMPMMPPGMFNPATNPMMANMPANYPMMAFPPGFYPPQNMANMQMMGYVFPQMNAPLPSNDNEVECLPVTHTIGLSKIPFKKIKLEKASKTVPQVEDLKKKILNDCTMLLDKLEFKENISGKFVFTPTVTKNNSSFASNSILQKFTNVSYNFQSIGPKQNLNEWGLRAIPDANVEIAKKISMSADRYFSKISENANTAARKMIKEEVKNADKTTQRKDEVEEVEEPTLSSFFKNSMTQTEPLTCKECVIRKRKVGHAIGVQATAFTGSIGSQTDPEVRYNEQLTQGLTNNQLKAMYEFSLLIREPSKNTTAELRLLPEQLLNMYNLSQRQFNGPVPFVNAAAVAPPSQSSARDPRCGPAWPQIQSVHSGVAAKQISVHMSREPSNSQHHGMHSAMQPQEIPRRVEAPNHPQQRARMPYQNTGYRPQQNHSWQNRQTAEQRGVQGEYPDLSLPDFPGQENRKNYGRGGHRR